MTDPTPSPAAEPDRDDAFLRELVRRGSLDAAQAEEVRRRHVESRRKGEGVSLDDLLVRAGHCDAAACTAARRAVASAAGNALRVGKYEILQRLGAGGSGIVYRAFQTSLEREVALKVLNKRREGEEEYLERFLREARVAVTLNHVNIVRGLDYGHADGYHYFAMEMVEGESLLASIQREGRLPEARAIDVVLQMVRALGHAQKFKIVHRDIKPENILLTKSGTAKLVDLGLARPLIDGGTADAAGKPMGTPLYVAPEQIRHDGMLDFRADVYSLGATLYHALTGAPPYLGATASEICRKHLQEPVPNPREKAIEVSTGTAAVCMKMLAKDPAERYQSLEALEEDLQACLDGRPPVNTITLGRRPLPLGADGAPPTISETAARRTAASGAGGAGIAMAAVLVLGAAGAGWWFLGREPEAPPTPPVPVHPPAPPPPVTPPPDPVKVAREKAADEALAAAERRAGQAGEEDPEFLRALDDIVGLHGGTPAASHAAARKAHILARREERIAAELKARGEKASRAEAEGRLGEAAAAWAGIPAAWTGTEAEATAAAAVARIRASGAALLSEARALVARARDGSDEEADRAREALDRVVAAGLAPLDAEAAREREELDAYRAGREARLAAAAAAWPGAVVEALGSLERGSARVREVLAGRAAELAPYADRVDSLAALADDAGVFLDAARSGFQKAATAGESVRLRVASRPGGVLVGRAASVSAAGFEVQRGPAVETVAAADIHPEDVAALAWRVLTAGNARAHRGAAVFLLSRGAFTAAEVEAKALEAGGNPAEAMRVRTVADACREAARQRADEALREAEVLRVQKRLPEARAAYARAALLCEGYAPALWRHGAFLLETDRDAGPAAALLEQAAALDPGDAEPWYWIGEARRRTGRLEEALAAYDRFFAGTASAAAPPTALVERARKAVEEVRTAAAVAAGRTAREEGARLLRKEQWAESAEQWRRVLRFVPGDPDATFFLGRCLLQLGRPLDAYLQMREFLSLPKIPAGRAEEARKFLREMENDRAGADKALVRAKEGALLRGQKLFREAAEKYAEAHFHQPLAPEHLVERASCLQNAWSVDGRKEDLAAAGRDLELALRLNERDGRSWTELSIVRLSQGDMKAAAAAAAKGVELDTSSARASEVLARASLALQRWVEAEEAATEGLRREAGAGLLLARAEARIGKGEPEDALKDVETAERKFELDANQRQWKARLRQALSDAGVDSE